MKTLYLMRHGETIFNQKMLLQGQCDAPLTKLGINQAKIAGQYFTNNNIKIDQFFASPLKRAIDTLKLVTNLQDVELTCDDGLMEWGFGLLEGESQKLFPCGFPYEERLVPFNGEAQSQVLDRFSNAINSIIEQTQEGNTSLCVAHTCVIRLFLQVCKADCEVPRRLGNCAIVKLEFDNNEFIIKEVIEHDFSSIME